MIKSDRSLVILFLLMVQTSITMQADPLVDALDDLRKSLVELADIVQKPVKKPAGGAIPKRSPPVAPYVSPVRPIAVEDKIIWEYKTFDEWNSACQNLPFYDTAKRQPDVKADRFTFIELQKAATSFAKVLQEGSMGKDSSWAAGKAPEKDFFDLALMTFNPYVEKLMVAPGNVVVFHGDLHADIQSLLKMLVHFKNEKILDQQNAFKIADQRYHFVFLGDSVDRGWYGAEVFYTLLRFKIANPYQVHILRGNHEDSQLVETYGFETELFTKFIVDFAKDTDAGASRILSFYNMFDLLPVALYVGCGTSTSMNFIQSCHGGMESGYCPKAFLKTSPSIQFDWLGLLNRRKILNESIGQQQARLGSGKATMQDLIDLAAVETMIAVATNLDKTALDDNFEPEEPGQLDFLWGDFIVNPFEKTAFVTEFKELFPVIIAQSIFDRSVGDLVVRLLKKEGKNLFVRDSGRGGGTSTTVGNIVTAVLLADASTAEASVRGVFRAHQQSGQMRDKIVEHGGVAKLWQSATCYTKDGTLWSDMVFTFMAGPNSNIGVGFDYDYFGTVTFAASFDDWRFNQKALKVEKK